MRRLVVRQVARAEIQDAFDWYLARSPEAAARFLDVVDAAIGEILANPEASPVVRGNLRRRLLPTFPYGVYYKLYPTVISVVGVIHGHRHPDTWLRHAGL